MTRKATRRIVVIALALFNLHHPLSAALASPMGNRLSSISYHLPFLLFVVLWSKA